jgi:hypothetical protein
MQEVRDLKTGVRGKKEYQKLGQMSFRRVKKPKHEIRISKFETNTKRPKVAEPGAGKTSPLSKSPAVYISCH